MSKTAIIKLINSSKATVLVAVIVALAVLVYLGKLEAQQMLDAIKVLVPGWMLAHAGETGAKALANGKLAHADVLALLSDGPAKLTTAEVDYAKRRFGAKADADKPSDEATDA